MIQWKNSKGKIRKPFELKKKKIIYIYIYLNIWDVARAVFRGQFTEIEAYIRKQNKLHISNLSLKNWKKGEKKQQQNKQ